MGVKLMPTSSELAQLRLLMQLQNQQNRIQFPTVTPTSGGAGVNFLQGLSGGLGYGMQVRQQRQSVEQLNQMMQAQAAAEQQAAAAQMARNEAFFRRVNLPTEAAGIGEELQKTYLNQVGPSLNSAQDVKAIRDSGLLQQPMADAQGNPIYDTNGNLVMMPTNDSRDLILEAFLRRTPGALAIPQNIAQAKAVGENASAQAFNDKIRYMDALRAGFPKDKNGKLSPAHQRTLDTAYTQAFGGVPMATEAGLQKEILDVQTAETTLGGLQRENTSKDLINQKNKIGIGEIQNIQAREAQYQKDAADIRNRIDLAEPDKIRLLAARRTMYGLDNGVSVSDFFNTGKVDQSSGMAGFNTITNEAKNQAMDAAKPQQPSFYQSAIAPALQSFTNWAKQDPGAKPQKPQMINVPGSYFNPQMLMGGQQGLNSQSFRQPPSFMLGR